MTEDLCTALTIDRLMLINCLCKLSNNHQVVDKAQTVGGSLTRR